MDVSFGEHVDRLLAQLKVELLQHHEASHPPPPCPVSPPPPPVVTSRQLEKVGKSGPESLPKKGLFGQVVSDSEDSDEELQSPKQVRDLTVPHLEPKIFAAPSSVPPPLVSSEAFTSGEVEVKSQGTPKREFDGSPGSKSESSDSFGSSSEENISNRKVLPPTFPRTGSAIPEFFRASTATESKFRLFVEDPDSGTFAFYFAQLQSFFLLMTSGTIIWQASRIPGTTMLPNSVEINIIHCICEGFLIFDCVVHWFVSPSCKTYIQSPYNIIDLLAILPLPLRISMGIPLPSMDENLVVHVLLVGFVPFIRLLKMVRRFHKMQLLLHVLSTTIEVLKLLLFMVSIIVLAFSIVLYIVDDPLEIDSLSTAIYMCIVTVTTVGYGDITPKSWPARVVSGCLCFISVLFMAMPLSVVGNAMSETWSDRYRILLVTRARRRLKTWGVSADDLPKIFKKFDADGNGELGMDEFINLISQMKVGIKPSEASDLFLAFDTDGSGGIDEKEFMKTLFPVDYRRIYRRASAA